MENQAFNATDVVQKGMPTRKIMGYFVEGATSYLWYEHGGRGHHQHLVGFNSETPEEIKSSYVFSTTSHRRIKNLIEDTEFLRDNINKGGEL